MKKLQLLFVAAIAIMISFTACDYDGAYSYSYEDWDTDGNELIDNDEFRTGFANANNYRDWDTDGDGMLNEREWDEGVTAYPANNNYGMFSDWDMDGNNEIDENEFSDGMFETWDSDDDGYVDNDEYDEWDDV